MRHHAPASALSRPAPSHSLARFTRSGLAALGTAATLVSCAVTSSIEQLGFDVDDVAIILNSHAHLDHAGGHAAFEEASYPGIADDYRRSFSVLRGVGCEIFLGSHGSFFGLSRKLEAMRAGSATNPFLDPEGCAAYVDRAEARFIERLAGAST